MKELEKRIMISAPTSPEDIVKSRLEDQKSVDNKFIEIKNIGQNKYKQKSDYVKRLEKMALYYGVDIDPATTEERMWANLIAVLEDGYPKFK